MGGVTRPIAAMAWPTAVGTTFVLAAASAMASVSPPPATWPVGRPASGLPLFADCTTSNCHTGTSNATDRLGKVGGGANNPAKINNAILNGTMTNATLRALTAQQIADIAAYLGNPGAANAPAASVAPPSLTFASTAVGATSPAQTVTLANSGSAALVLGALTVSAGFVLSGGTCSVGASLAPGASCTAALAFAPTIGGAASGTLTFSHNAAPSTSTVALSASATVPAPVASVTPPSLAFSQVTGTVSPTQTVRVANQGGAPLTLASVVVTGAQASEFPIAANGCGGTIAAGASCAIDIAFAPAAIGARSASLVVSHNAPGSPSTVALSGSGNASPQPVVSVSNNVIDVGTVPLGSSATGSVTVTNSGQATLVLAALGVSGSSASDYALVGTCGAGVSLAVGAQCTLAARFAPTALGTRSASVALTSNAPSVTVGLTGSGAAAPAAIAALAPGATDFGTVTVGAAPVSRTFTLSNAGTAALDIAAVAVDDTDFAATSGCGSSVAPSGSCSIVVAFAPAAATTYAGTLTITSNGGKATAALTGSGSLAPVPVLAWVGVAAFADTAVGSTSAPVSLTLVNQGPGASTLTSLAASSAEFVVGGTCVAGTVLAGGSSCAVTLAFAPAAVGPRPATLSIAASGSPPPPLALSGNGILAAQQALTVTPNAVSFPAFTAGTTVAPVPLLVANSGTTPIRVTALRFASGLFVGTPRCGALPIALAPGASCVVDLAPDPASASAPGDLVDTLTVATDSPGMSHALAVVASVEPPAVAMTNVGAAGCSIVAPASARSDPTLWLLVVAAAAVLVIRRRAARGGSLLPRIDRRRSMNRRLPIAAAAALCTALAAGPARALDPGQPAPDIELPGAAVAPRLAALKGKVVYVDFWASWCGPCRQSFPWLNDMQQKYGAQGLQVVGVNVDTKRADAEQFLSEVPARFAIAFDPKGDAPRRAGIKGMPTAVLIGADGKVLKVHQGFRENDRAELEALLVAALAAAKAQ
jgi:thiol-disulfide isomerase/thioredoxin